MMDDDSSFRAPSPALFNCTQARCYKIRLNGVSPIKQNLHVRGANISRAIVPRLYLRKLLAKSIFLAIKVQVNGK